MKTIREIIGACERPFAPDEVGVKIQSQNRDKTRGMAVVFVDANTVSARLDEATDGLWDSSFVVQHHDAKGATVECAITVRGLAERTDVNPVAITRFNVGEGETLKAAYSDALKRCAVHFGVGRALSSVPRTWFETVPDKGWKDEAAVRRKVAGLLARVSSPVAGAQQPQDGPQGAGGGRATPAPDSGQDGAVEAQDGGDKDFATLDDLGEVTFGFAWPMVYGVMLADEGGELTPEVERRIRGRVARAAVLDDDDFFKALAKYQAVADANAGQA